MRLGFDVDGVLADFNPGYVQRVIKVTGVNLFPKEIDWAAYPDCWDYDGKAGYDNKQLGKVWGDIAACPVFWRSLGHYRDNLLQLASLDGFNDVYFITSRPGRSAKRQTEEFLTPWVKREPTVLISSKKGLSCAALGIDAYIDDKPENIMDVVAQSPGTMVFLLNQPWNKGREVPKNVVRVDTVKEFLESLEVAA